MKDKNVCAFCGGELYWSMIAGALHKSNRSKLCPQAKREGRP